MPVSSGEEGIAHQAGHWGATAITQHQITSSRWLQASSSDSLPMVWRAGPSHKSACTYSQDWPRGLGGRCLVWRVNQAWWHQ